MKLRSEVRADLAERLDLVAPGKDHEATVRARRDDAAPAEAASSESLIAVTTIRHSRSQRHLMIALAAVMLAAIFAGLAYTMTRSDNRGAAKRVTAALQIESTPAGAAVFVAGEPTGLKTPTTLTEITGKRLSIRLELPNHGPVTRNIDVRAGGTVSTHVVLKPLQGRLVISNLPPNASIFVDGDEYSAGDVIPTVAGRHVVRVVVEGRTILEQAVEATAGDLGLKFAPGKLVGN